MNFQKGIQNSQRTWGCPSWWGLSWALWVQHGWFSPAQPLGQGFSIWHNWRFGLGSFCWGDSSVAPTPRWQQPKIPPDLSKCPWGCKISPCWEPLAQDNRKCIPITLLWVSKFHLEMVLIPLCPGSSGFHCHFIPYQILSTSYVPGVMDTVMNVTVLFNSRGSEGCSGFNLEVPWRFSVPPVPTLCSSAHSSLHPF